MAPSTPATSRGGRSCHTAPPRPPPVTSARDAGPGGGESQVPGSWGVTPSAGCGPDGGGWGRPRKRRIRHRSRRGASMSASSTRPATISAAPTGKVHPMPSSVSGPVGGRQHASSVHRATGGEFPCRFGRERPTRSYPTAPPVRDGHTVCSAHGQTSRPERALAHGEGDHAMGIEIPPRALGCRRRSRLAIHASC